jgi:pre-rRNA-processing protein RIX1
MAKNDVSEINPVLKAACQDILGDEYIAAANGSSGGINQQLGLPGGQTAQSYPTDVSELTEAARNLIKTALLKLDAAMITPSLRAQMDRRAVFARDEEMLLASVMNPPKKSGNGRTPSSLLPILAREYGDSLEAEMLLRPRMPTVYATAQRDAAVSSAENMDDDDEQDEEEANSEHSADIFESFEEDTSADVAVDAAAAEADPDTTALSEHASTKRRALDEIPQETSAKRLRASPEAGVPQSESASLLGPESMTLRSNVPKVLVEPKAVQRTTQASVQAQQSSLGLPEQSGGQGEEDDSDFEMPPLTMEQDTEPEDEDEDDS